MALPTQESRVFVAHGAGEKLNFSVQRKRNTMKLKNITRYPIHIRVAHQVRKSDLIDVVLPPSGIVARAIRSS